VEGVVVVAGPVVPVVVGAGVVVAVAGGVVTAAAWLELFEEPPHAASATAVAAPTRSAIECLTVLCFVNCTSTSSRG
jgi:Na+/glutamate symporter